MYPCQSKGLPGGLGLVVPYMPEAAASSLEEVGWSGRPNLTPGMRQVRGKPWSGGHRQGHTGIDI